MIHWGEMLPCSQVLCFLTVCVYVELQRIRGGVCAQRAQHATKHPKIPTYLLTPPISNVKAEVFHLYFHGLAFLKFETEMIFLVDSEKFLEEEQRVSNSRRGCEPPFQLLWI